MNKNGSRESSLDPLELHDFSISIASLNQQIRNLGIKRPSDPFQSRDVRATLPSFEEANVSSVMARFLCKLFLGHPKGNAMPANYLANSFADLALFRLERPHNRRGSRPLLFDRHTESSNLS